MKGEKKKVLGTGKEKLSFPFAFAVSCNSEKKKTNKSLILVLGVDRV